jgi:hypothetical protein
MCRSRKRRMSRQRRRFRRCWIRTTYAGSGRVEFLSAFGRRGSVFIFFHANKPIPVFRFSSGKLSVPGPCLPLQSRNLVRRQGSGRWSATSPKTTGSPSFPSPSTLTATAAAPARIRPMSGALRVPPVSGTGRVKTDGNRITWGAHTTSQR